jgi:hypothetical protein
MQEKPEHGSPNTEPETRNLTSPLPRISAVCQPVPPLTHLRETIGDLGLVGGPANDQSLFQCIQ